MDYYVSNEQVGRYQILRELTRSYKNYTVQIYKKSFILSFKRYKKNPTKRVRDHDIPRATQGHSPISR